MRIAVATENDRVSAHFGHCEGFTLFQVEGRQTISSRFVPNPGHRPGFLPNYLHELGVDVVISGGMGGGAIDIFGEQGIEVVTGANGPVQAVADQYVNGLLESTGTVCHEHVHQDGCHS